MFEVVGRLKNLLSKENVQVLDEILTLILSNESPAFKPLWSAFRKAEGDESGEKYRAAYLVIKELHEIVKTYRRGQA